MKTNKICIGLLLAFTFITSYSFAQEPVVASIDPQAKKETPVQTTEAATEAEQKKEEEEPKFTLSGSVDTYFHTTFGSQWNGTKAPGTSFANQPGFGLGMANLIASYGGEKVGFTADLVFGPRGKEAVFGNLTTGQGIVNQLNVFFKPTEKVTLTLGQFNTFLGYEVISPTLNFHYSTSYMFSWGPFSHTGLRADFDLGNGLVAKLGVLNPTDLVEFNPVNTYTIGGQFGYTNEKGGIWFNALAGDQDGTLNEDDGLATGQVSDGITLQGDITAGWNLTETFYLGLNTTYRTLSKGQTFNGSDVVKTDEDAKGFMGVAVYPKLTLSESFALGLRAEYFQVSKGYMYYEDGNGDPAPYAFARDAEGTGSVTAFTLSANYKIGGLTLIPEFRTDMTSEESYSKVGETDLSKQMLSFNLAAVYKF